MQKTVLCHFYNEEWLLPFWLKHHREIFDHGIMIDYHSTDRSVEIIREYCPSWQIVTSRNPDFKPEPIDSEVVDLERPLNGWRVALNATEFLVGNYDHLSERHDPVQIFLGQYMFVDMERREEVFYLDINRPLWEQRWYGYPPVTDFSQNQSHGSVPRAPRSIHNHPVTYPYAGRHYPQNQSTYPDLAIFYMGYASMEEASLQRKMQIQTQIPENFKKGSNHYFTKQVLLDRYRLEQQPMSRNISQDIKPIVDAHNAYLAAKKSKPILQTREDIQSAIIALNTALERLQ